MPAKKIRILPGSAQCRLLDDIVFTAEDITNLTGYFDILIQMDLSYESIQKEQKNEKK